MYEIVTKSMFMDWFGDYGKGCFSYEALSELFDYLDKEKDVEFSPVAIEAFWNERSLRDYMKDYGIEPKETIEETIEAIEHHLEHNTIYLTIDKQNDLDGMALYMPL